MNVKWAATLAIVVGALAAWRATASKPDRGGSTNPDRAAPVAIDARGAALDRQIARLRDRLEPDVAPRLARNLFRFAAIAPHPAPVVLATNRAPIEPAAVPAQPALKLIGVAEDMVGGRLIRTAIISGADQVFVVKEGERVTSRYLVARISADVAELQDTSEGRGDSGLRRLALK